MKPFKLKDTLGTAKYTVSKMHFIGINHLTNGLLMMFIGEESNQRNSHLKVGLRTNHKLFLVTPVRLPC